jgi:uncharacterized protein YebE (UPF0316 family)
MLKIIIIFIAGVVETYLFTGWSIAANKAKAILSSILMLTYMITYLLILDTAFKDKNSVLMILDYAISCAVGNYIRVKKEQNILKKKK